MTPQATVAALALGVLLAGAVGAAWARRRVRQDLRPARAFAALGLAVLPLALATALGTGSALAAVPVASVSALCLAAGWSFHPTAASRFADFERAYRSYAEHHARSGR